MGAQSKRKGDAFENQVCRALTQWVTGERPTYLKDCVFRRRSTSIMPSEGHWHGAGDILHRPQYDWWPFAIEAKSRAEWKSLDGMFGQKQWPVWKYWETANVHAERSGKLPMLIFTRPRQPVLVMLETDTAMDVVGQSIHDEFDGPIMDAMNGEASVSILLLEDLIKTTTPSGLNPSGD